MDGNTLTQIGSKRNKGLTAAFKINPLIDYWVSSTAGFLKLNISTGSGGTKKKKNYWGKLKKEKIQ